MEVHWTVWDGLSFGIWLVVPVTAGVMNCLFSVYGMFTPPSDGDPWFLGGIQNPKELHFHPICINLFVKCNANRFLLHPAIWTELHSEGQQEVNSFWIAGYVSIWWILLLFLSDIYDDLISRRVNSSDAEKFANICPCPCNGVGWGAIW